MYYPNPHPWIDSLALYEGGKHGKKENNPICLSANENPLGPSPAAIEVLKRNIGNLNRYPDQHSSELRHTLATECDCSSDNIVVGCGSDELLSLLTACYTSPGDNILYSAHGFLMYRLYALRVGAEPIQIAEKNLSPDKAGFWNAVNDRTRLIFLANPNNPTGSYLNRDELKELHSKLPKSCILVVDAAYAEYLDKEDYNCGLELAKSTDNVVMTRSFSKIFGLAGLRLGWIYAPLPIAQTLTKARMPFNVSKAAQEAGLQAFLDKDHVIASRRQTIRSRERLTSELKARGFDVPDSVGNFLLCNFESLERAKKAFDFLAARNIWVRGVDACHLPNYLRISIGLDEEIDQFLSALDRFIKT